jgi:hypothetical protein
MPVLPPSTTSSYKVIDIITDALLEMGGIAQGQAPSGSIVQLGLRKLNRLIDTFNAKKLFIYAVSFDTYTYTPNLAIHTIGPGGDFDVAQRPVKIQDAAVILNDVDVPVDVEDAQWWAGQTVKAQTSTFPTSLYYEPAWPLGKIYLWPIPTVAYDLRLETWVSLTQFEKLTDSFSLPPGYLELIISGLAVTLCPAFGKSPDATLVANAQRALVLVQGNNSKAPRISLAGGGLPGGGPTYFDWRTGNLV